MLSKQTVIQLPLLEGFLELFMQSLQQGDVVKSPEGMGKKIMLLCTLLQGIHKTSLWRMMITPALLEKLFTIFSLLHSTEQEQTDQEYVTAITTAKMVLTLDFLNDDCICMISGSPSLIERMKEDCVEESSWKRRALMITLLTEIQIRGTEVNITPSFIAACLREKNMVVMKACICLFYLNIDQFKSALQLLSADEMTAFLKLLVHGGNITLTDVNKKSAHAYSTEVCSILNQNIHFGGTMTFVDFPSLSQCDVNSLGRYMIALLRVCDDDNDD